MSKTWHKVKRPSKQTLLSPKENDAKIDAIHKTPSARENRRIRRPLMAVSQNENLQPARLRPPKILDLQQKLLDVAKENPKEDRLTSPTYDLAYMTKIPEKRARPQAVGSLHAYGVSTTRQRVHYKAIVDRFQEKPSNKGKKHKEVEATSNGSPNSQDLEGEVHLELRVASKTGIQHLGDSKIKDLCDLDAGKQEDTEGISRQKKRSSSESSSTEVEKGSVAASPTSSGAYSACEFDISQGLPSAKGMVSSAGDDKLRNYVSAETSKIEPQKCQQLLQQESESNLASELLKEETPPISSPTKRPTTSAESSQILSNSPSTYEPPTSSTDLLSPDVQYEVHTIYPNPTGKTLTEKLGIVTNNNDHIDCIISATNDKATNRSCITTPSPAHSATIPLSLDVSEYDVISAFPNPAGKTLLEKLALAAQEVQHLPHAYSTDDEDDIPSSPSY